jgi:hypothetical protein
MSSDNAASVEEIPESDELGRAFFQLPEGIAPETEFPFYYDRVRGECAESVFWRKYAPSVVDLHQRGCDIESQKKARAAQQSKPFQPYIGARYVIVSHVTACVTARGFSLQVIHLPENGDRAHSHIAIVPVDGQVPSKIKSNDKTELAACLLEKFGDLHWHRCESA